MKSGKLPPPNVSEYTSARVFDGVRLLTPDQARQHRARVRLAMESEIERALIVKWLRGGAAFSGSWCDRIRGAWFIITKPEVVMYSLCLQISDAIERCEHVGEGGRQ